VLAELAQACNECLYLLAGTLLNAHWQWEASVQKICSILVAATARAQVGLFLATPSRHRDDSPRG